MIAEREDMTPEDIAERTRAEQALKESEERFRSLIESSRDVITIIDRDGMITYTSPSFERTTGYRPEDLIGVSAFHHVHPDDVAGLRARLDESLTGKPENTPITFRYLHRNGSWRFFEAVGSNRLHDPATKGIVLNSRDVTERLLAEESIQKLQEQLRQSQKLEAIGLLAGGVAHDFNNLLTAILGYTELLAAEAGAGSPLAEPIEEIRKAGERAVSLTRQLLAFSRKQVLEPRVLDVNALLENLDRMLRQLIGGDIELVTFLDSGIGRVRADAGQIEQVVMNLTVNARDAMPDGGTITIETRRVELDRAFLGERAVEGPPGAYVMISVTDTGVGMSAATKSRIFEPFFTTKSMGHGTGLGLATVYGIVKQSGGYIWVYSEPGLGATFKIYLPQILGETEEPARRASVRVPLLGGSETILLVENDDSVRALALKILESCGYTVLPARRGSEALELARRHAARIHLLLSDVIMPGMGGSELAAQLALLRPEARYLFMSGYANDAISRRGILEPGRKVLHKPFTVAELALAVREALDGPSR